MTDVRGPYLLPRDAYPFTIEAFRVSDDERVWQTTVEAPDGLTAIRIPPLAAEHGPVYMVTTYANGETERADPAGRR